MNPDLFWIPGPWRGGLAVLTRPRGGDWLDDEVSGWRQAGLDVVVSLLERQETTELQLDREADAAKLRGIHFISFPIPDRGIPAHKRDAIALFGKLGAALAEGKKIAVHCRQGIGRSGLIVAGMLVTHGISSEKAVEVVSSARRRPIPDTAEQLRWIEQLPSEQLIPTS